MNNWKYLIKEYFTFTKGDRNAIMLLSFLCIGIITLNIALPYILPAPQPPDFSAFQAQIKLLEQNLADIPVSSNTEENITPTDLAKASLFQFNPNNLTFNQGLQLGLSKKVSKTIQKYLSKGGKFYKKEDFKKIYGVTEQDYQLLSPFMVLSVKQQTGEKQEKAKDLSNFDTKKLVKLDNFNPNKLTIEQSRSLGLSKKVAKTIQNYLSKGGKFYKKEDFKKIYGIREKDYELLSPYIDIPKTAEKNRKVKDNKAIVPQLNTTPITLSEFDPNKLTVDKALKLGLSKKVANTLQNYLKKGGKFYKKEDFKKVYGLTQNDYERLAPFITIEEQPKEREPSKKTKETDIQIDINTATIEDWQKLRGIGPTYAKRIVKYRDLLGGFSEKKQLQEVYGFKLETYEYIKSNLVNTATNKLQKINVNQATIEQLAKHPYISEKVAKGIVQTRKKNGGFKQLAAIKNVKKMDVPTFQKISPYLKLKD